MLCFEKTPTLCGIVPAFEGLRRSLEKLMADRREATFIIQAGLDKLTGYYTVSNKTLSMFVTFEVLG